MAVIDEGEGYLRVAQLIAQLGENVGGALEARRKRKDQKELNKLLATKNAAELEDLQATIAERQARTAQTKGETEAATADRRKMEGDTQRNAGLLSELANAGQDQFAPQNQRKVGGLNVSTMSFAPGRKASPEAIRMALDKAEFHKAKENKEKESVIRGLHMAYPNVDQFDPDEAANQFGISTETEEYLDRSAESAKDIASTKADDAQALEATRQANRMALLGSKEQTAKRLLDLNVTSKKQLMDHLRENKFALGEAEAVLGIYEALETAKGKARLGLAIDEAADPTPGPGGGAVRARANRTNELAPVQVGDAKKVYGTKDPQRGGANTPPPAATLRGRAPITDDDVEAAVEVAGPGEPTVDEYLDAVVAQAQAGSKTPLNDAEILALDKQYRGNYTKWLQERRKANKRGR